MCCGRVKCSWRITERFSGSAGTDRGSANAGRPDRLCRNKKVRKDGRQLCADHLIRTAALAGFSNYGSFSDLMIWSVWCLLNAILAVVAIITEKKKA